MFHRILSLVSVSLLLASCASSSKTSSTPFSVIEFKKLPEIGRLKDVGEFHVGGFSGLYLHEIRDGRWVFRTLTDRGPNAKKHDFDGDGHKDRPFAFPNFQPKIVEFTFDPKIQALNITKTWDLSGAKGTKFTGLPNVKRGQHDVVFDETPVTFAGQPLPNDKYGLDTEGITVDNNGFTWIVEEYGPSVLKLNQDLKVIKRLIPELPQKLKGQRYGEESLPKILTRRRLNRGFEGITYSDNKLYVILQSPIPLIKKTKWVRILEIDTTSDKVSGMYLYRLKKRKGKLGGITAIGNQEFLIIEQSGDPGPEAQKQVYRVSLKGATNFLRDSEMEVEKMSKKELAKKDIVPVSKDLFLDLAEMGLYTIDKFEGITTIGQDTIVLINDNDFGVEQKINLETGEVTQSQNGQKAQLFVFKKKL